MVDKIRVLHVLDILTSNSGTTNVVMNYVRQTPQSNYVIDIVVHKESDKYLIDEVEKFGGKVFKITDIKLNTFLVFKKEFGYILKNNEYKIIHGHVANSVFLYMSEAKKQNTPIRIIHSHTTRNSSTFLKRIRNSILNFSIPHNCNYYFSCSKAAGDSLFSKFTTEKNVIIIPNSIDTNKFKYNQEIRNQLRNRYNLNNYFIIGHVGRFANEKNHTFLIKAFHDFIKNNEKCKLVLIGDGYLRGEIEQLIKKNALENKVLLLGVKSNVNEFYQMFDCFWFPSFYEGFGLAALEAQCSNLPCIVSENIPSDVMITSDVQTCELNDMNKWLLLTEAIKNKIPDRKDNSEILKNAGYDIEEQGKRLFKCYDSFL
jgi:glycosyltransferase involved in cell wall biosynthesis